MKIAIINNWPHQYTGGIESYTRELIYIFLSKGWEVTEFSTLSPEGKPGMPKPIKGVKQINISNGSKFYRKSAHKFFDNLLIADKFDLFINNSLVTKKSLNSKKVIGIQHMERSFFSFKSPDRWFSFLNAIFLKIGSTKTMLDHKNTVFFTHYENKKNDNNPLYVTTPLQKKFSYTKRKRSGESIFWLGRLEEPHKGLKNLVKIFDDDKNRRNLVIGGDGPDAKILKPLKENMVGRLGLEEVKIEMNRAKVLIMTSNTEGFPLVIIEALASGTPAIIYNSFESASFFKNEDSVRLVKLRDSKAFKKEIETIMSLSDDEWISLSLSATNFAKKEFSKKSFEEKWINYINKIIS